LFEVCKASVEGEDWDDDVEGRWASSWEFSEGVVSKAERPWWLAAYLSICNVTGEPHCLSDSAALKEYNWKKLGF